MLIKERNYYTKTDDFKLHQFTAKYYMCYNYCTKCGKKLDGEEVCCKNCGTPVIDLMVNYKKTSSKFIKVLLFLIGGSFIIIFINDILFNAKIGRLEKKYVVPVVKKIYDGSDYTIKYKDNGDCILSGNCDFDPVFGCDGGTCKTYKYHNKGKCKAYYYKVNTGKDEFTITVFEDGKNTFARKGIYVGGEEEQDEDSFSKKDGEVNE